MPETHGIHVVEVAISPTEAREIAIAFLSQSGLSDIEEIEDGLRIYQHDKAHLEKVISELSGRGFLDRDKCSFYTIPDVNWNRKWESSFDPVRIGNFCSIRASFHPPVHDVTYDVIINPEMAFGTGHHETTALMIEMMRRIPMSGKRVLDFGCGTGVLAILAEKMGATKVIAIDNDDQAIRCANDQLALNNSRNVSLSTTPVESLDEGDFGVVLANINRNVLLANAPLLASYVKSGGYLLLSGILQTDIDCILSTYKKLGMKVGETKSENEWTAALLVGL